MIENRLRKNVRHLSKWARRQGTEAYRLYDKDMPEYPFIIDRYGDYVVVYEKGKSDVDASLRTQHHADVTAAIVVVIGVPESHIVWKIRESKSDSDQYEKQSSTGDTFTVKEGPAWFIINVHDYLDTGLFLDHRPTRARIYESSRGLRVLNLFSYTGSISVMAALGGGTVTSVDMSKTYQEWARDNFIANDISLARHRFIVENAFDFLRENREEFDFIFLDPPTFSNSKRMSGVFDVERDHGGLIRMAMDRLAPRGVLYFSTNKRKFRLDPDVAAEFIVKDITIPSIPEDFRDSHIHALFDVRHP